MGPQAASQAKIAPAPRRRRISAPTAKSLTSRMLHVLGSLGGSLFIHLILLAVMGAMTWAVTTAGQAVRSEYRVKVVREDEERSGPPGGYRFPGRAYTDRPDSARAAHESDMIEDLATLLSKEQAFSLAPTGGEGTGLDKLVFGELGRSDVVGVGTGGGVGSGGLGSGLGDRDLAGGGPVGSLWGVGRGQVARSIVYVMDRSGSMGYTFDLLQRELMRALGSLREDQYFNVIWFNEGPANELSPRLLAATLENKRKAFEAIKVIVPAGQTEPIDAIRKGLDQKPDVLFLLSDGDFGEDNERIKQIIRQKNAGRAATINTILFVYDTMGGGEKVLREIAEQNGGAFKHVTEQDLRR